MPMNVCEKFTFEANVSLMMTLMFQQLHLLIDSYVNVMFLQVIFMITNTH